MSDDEKRGQWGKDKADRGLYQRGKIWYIRFADQTGKVRAERVGPSKALALKVYMKRKSEVAERRFFPGANTGFEDLLKDAVTEARRRHAMKKSKKQLMTYRYGILGDWFKGRKATTITSEEIDAKLSEHCKTPANYNRYRNSLSHTYKLGIESGKVAANPARAVKLRQENNTRVRFLDAKEELALRKVIIKRCPDREAEFDLAMQTGMRWSEQYELKWEQVDLGRNQITLLQTKSGRRQHVQINLTARAALEKLRSRALGSEFVCPDQDHYIFRKWWEAVLKESKVKDFHWHDLRHTFATRLVMGGVDIFTVKQLLRHETIAVTMRYAHLSATHLQQAVEVLAVGILGGTVAQKLIQPMPRVMQ